MRAAGAVRLADRRATDVMRQADRRAGRSAGKLLMLFSVA
jgi:hypothetical protein